MAKNIIIFDFDGTLTPHTLPKFEVLKRCGFPNGIGDIKFMKRVATRVATCGDPYYALYDAFLRVIAKSNFPLTDDTIAMGAEQIEFNDGVCEFLKTLKENGIQNYILSSGLKAYLEKSSIRDFVTGIFATTFSYDREGDIEGVGFCMNSKRKVSAIKAIMRQQGLREDDAKSIIYIGDGLTDSYAMTYIKKNGGTSIFVVDHENMKDIDTMRDKNIVDVFVEKDYNPGSDLTTLIKRACEIDFKEMI